MSWRYIAEGILIRRNPMVNPLYTYRYIMSTPRASSLPVFNDVESKYSLCLTNA